MMRRKYAIPLIVFVSILSIDQSTKSLVEDYLFLYDSIPVIPGFFNLTHVRNPGGAFGIFSDQKGGTGSLLFVIFSLLAIGVLLFLLWRAKEEEEIHSLSLALILSGAIGNLIDRLRYGEVIDFLDFHLSSFHWPAFNIADSAICIGIGLMLFILLKQDRKKTTAKNI